MLGGGGGRRCPSRQPAPSLPRFPPPPPPSFSPERLWASSLCHASAFITISCIMCCGLVASSPHADASPVFFACGSSCSPTPPPPPRFLAFCLGSFKAASASAPVLVTGFLPCVPRIPSHLERRLAWWEEVALSRKHGGGGRQQKAWGKSNQAPCRPEYKRQERAAV